MKYFSFGVAVVDDAVAPCAGAWVEMGISDLNGDVWESPPVRGRGLKFWGWNGDASRTYGRPLCGGGG